MVKYFRSRSFAIHVEDGHTKRIQNRYLEIVAGSPQNMSERTGVRTD